MKFAIFLAFIVLSQCLGTEAWYITSRNFNSFKSESRNGVASVRNRANSLSNTRHSQGRSVSSIGSRVYSAKSSMDISAKTLKQAWTIYWVGYHLCWGIYRQRSSHEARIRKFETMNDAVYRRDMLTYLIENIKCV